MFPSLALNLSPGWAQTAPEWTQMGKADKATELMLSGRTADAIPVAKARLAQAEAAIGPSHPDLLPHLHTLGTAYMLRKAFDDAEPVLKRALDIAERSFGRTDQHTIDAANDLVALYAMDERWAEAKEMMKRANPPR
ncbi:MULTISPECIES: tetratricopeptide repeat protein [Bradyrhizobium]|uniref:tetratricopeptide repeat protein n=1 Tax=Bradyrhizobium TaxID=374 RepID=UPI00138ADAD9|nr:MULTISPECIES: tetratricopeptide repeat protein [unclassified Bradyrhizobium]